MSTTPTRACLPPLFKNRRPCTFASLAHLFTKLEPVPTVEAEFQLIKCAVGKFPSFSVVSVTAYSELIDEMALSEIGTNEGVTFEATGTMGHWIAKAADATYHLFRIL